MIGRKGHGWKAQGSVVLLAGAIAFSAGTPLFPVTSLAASRAHEQTPDALRCDALLTKEEATTVVGDTYQGPAFNEFRPGFTECVWQGNDSSISFTFATLDAMKQDSQTADEQFEHEVSAVEDPTRKRQMLTNLGPKAALVDLGDQGMLVAVQRPDGVVRIVFYKVAKDKVLALARAAAAP